MPRWKIALSLKSLRHLYVLLILVLLLGLVGAILHYVQQQTPLATQLSNPADLSSPTFVGRTGCASCHPEQSNRWQGSHHDLAMQPASDTSVLGDFNATEFNKDGITSRFFRQNGRFMVHTDGPDGALADFEIKYTFGVTPLQQYLIELPEGRLQALSIVWDSRSKESGGQRWFHLYPNERIDHNDELHWTKRSQNWNLMCAECHSTDFQKNYDPASHSYHSTWSEIDVSCEACHGPASRHLAWAKEKSADDTAKGLITHLSQARRTVWMINPASGNAVPHQPSGNDSEIEICARCHSRRAQLFGDYHYGNLQDSHLPSLLSEHLYHTDGQIDGEVYEYGSFMQSRMYHAGVSCSDCHDPHSLKLRQPGNALCGQCHSAAKYDGTQHHFHQPGQAGGLCVDCHMPSQTYMGVDTRRDHSFRIPRPDLSEQLGTPNACNACHQDKPSQWASQQLKTWYGHEGKSYQQYAEALYAARNLRPDAQTKLQDLLEDTQQPAIARATVVAEQAPATNLNRMLEQVLNDSNPLLRRAGLELLEQVAPEQRWALAHERLQDPVRSLRALAAAALAPAIGQNLKANDREAFERAAGEYLNSLQWNADDPAARVNLGNFHSARGQAQLAEQAYRDAIELEPLWLPAYINWADHLRVNQRDDEAKAVLQQGLRRLPEAAALHHSLGLLAIRQHQLPQALSSLKQAVSLEPNQPQFSLVYALLLVDLGQIDKAKNVLNDALEHSKNNPDLQELSATLAIQ